MIVIDIGRSDQFRRVRGIRLPIVGVAATNGNLQPTSRVSRSRADPMIREGAIENVDGGAGRLCQIRNLRWGETKVRRHPHRPEHPGREHGLQHRVGVPRVQQDTVAVTHTTFGKCGGRPLNAVAKRLPGSCGIAPDNRRPVRKPARRLNQQRRKVGGWDQRSGSRIET
jgi:hypothetical protein